MVLPLNLAMTAAEIWSAEAIPEHFAWMACHFSPYSQGLSNLPEAIPAGGMLILNDRIPCQGHSPALAASQLAHAAARFGCKSILLDFQRPPDAESVAVVQKILEVLPCPVGISEMYARDLDCPVFLPPPPLHITPEVHLTPWHNREIWLEAALCQEVVTVTESGTSFTPQFPPEHLTGGFYDETLLCRYHTEIRSDHICFTLFDTPESLTAKMEKVRTLGVTRAVGLYQELASFGK